ncbi:hypothetical protein HOY80DRAFT_985392 [Tuber brumale]|nr:hypothetical protein HOY80DRAFT_985392 [Tuber brumale]
MDAVAEGGMRVESAAGVEYVQGENKIEFPILHRTLFSPGISSLVRFDTDLTGMASLGWVGSSRNPTELGPCRVPAFPTCFYPLEGLIQYIIEFASFRQVVGETSVGNGYCSACSPPVTYFYLFLPSFLSPHHASLLPSFLPSILSNCSHDRCCDCFAAHPTACLSPVRLLIRQPVCSFAIADLFICSKASTGELSHSASVEGRKRYSPERYGSGSCI